MNKKTIIRISAITAAVVAVLLTAFTLLYIREIENYKQITFDDVLNIRKAYFSEHYGIGDKKNPADFGFNFETLEYETKPDNIRLHAWHVASKKKDTKKCIMLINGRGDNKLRTMQYLTLIKEKGIDSEYAIFIPDMRHSGMSGTGPTLMGNKFAEDILNTIKLAKNRYGYDKFILYGISMGAMASSVVNADPAVAKAGIVIEKLIMDSPLADVEENLYYNAAEQMGLPGFLPRIGFFFADLKHGGKLSRLKMSVLLKDVSIPVLILQSENDPRTPAKILRKVLPLLKNNTNIEVQYFPVGEHVKIYQNPKNRAAYAKRVADFIKKR